MFYNKDLIIYIFVALLQYWKTLYIAVKKILNMATKTIVIMPKQDPILEKLEADWNADSEKVLIRATVTKEASDFLEEMAFKDFGMMKKGAVGLELTKLLLIAKDCLDKQNSE